MSDEEIQGAQQLMMNAARMLLLIPHEHMQAVVDEIGRTDAFMPLFDPTGWMRIRGNIPGHLRVCRALLKARSEIADVIERELEIDTCTQS